MKFNSTLIMDFLNNRYAYKCRKASLTKYMRLTMKELHSLEKGFAMSSPKPGFGKAHIEKITTYVNETKKIGKLDEEVFMMVHSIFSQYVELQKSLNYSGDVLTAVENFLKGFENVIPDRTYGGAQKLTRVKTALDMPFNECVLSRHSTRNYSDEPIDKDKLKEAISLAAHCPSACNRQAFHAYILDSTQFDKLGPYKSGGIGGFIDKVKAIIVITGIVSAYEENESYQYIVSPSIFAGYLTLSLHAYGFGSCVVQRPVQHTRTWKNIARSIGAEEDEQIVCMITVGMPAEEDIYPQSHRLNIEKIMKEVSANNE